VLDGVTVLGGLCALVFLNLPSAWKPPFLLLPLAAQIGWTFYVIRRARTANIGVW
jgi:hypothetical protein